MGVGLARRLVAAEAAEAVRILHGEQGAGESTTLASAAAKLRQLLGGAR
jgi:hypothetical protein